MGETLMFLLLIALIAFANANSFIRYRDQPELAHARLARKAPLRTAASGVGCEACIDFFDVDLNTLLNIILQVGIGGTCQDLCGKLPREVEQVTCTLLCLVVGLEKFVNVLQNDDLDPLYLCAELHACKNNTCKGHCTDIEDPQAMPSS